MIQTKPTTFGNGWNLVLELIDYPNGARDTISYIWGPDLSGTPQGAGGVGGLYWLEYNDTVYVPSYDNNGNIIAYYHGITGEVVATYQYDAFGCTIAQSGTMASFFRHRFSTKYYDEETGLYYYGYRFYSPQMGRWLNRDPIEEDGGNNLYAFCKKNGLNEVDYLGQKCCIRIWGGVPGHMALKCDNGVYISKYPDKSRNKLLPQPQKMQDEEYDKKHFKKPPNEYCFSCVDENKISEWSKLHNEGTYFWANQSCIESVFDALKSALPEQSKPSCPTKCQYFIFPYVTFIYDRLERDIGEIPPGFVTPYLLQEFARKFAENCQRYGCGYYSRNEILFE